MKAYRHLYKLALIFAGLLFINTLLVALYRGGRWDLNEQIAFAYRLAEGIMSYCNGRSDLFFPSSPYFPGVGFLSYLYWLLGIKDVYLNNQLMIATSVAIGFLSLFLMYRISTLLYPKISKELVCIVLIILYATHFRDYKFYMIEFKPDTILLVFAYLVFLIFQSGQYSKIFKAIAIGIILFVSVFFKQSFFLIYLWTAILILSAKDFKLKRKVMWILLSGVIGLLALGIIFNIKNLYFFTVDIMGKHQFLDIGMIAYFFMRGFVNDGLFIALLLVYLFKNYKQLPVLNAESLYLIFAILWCGFSIIATIKDGGNTGNFEVGIIVFIPQAIKGLNDLLQRFWTYSVVPVLFLLILVVLSGYQLSLIRENYNQYAYKLEQDAVEFDYIKKRFSGKKAFVDGNTYVLAQRAGLKVYTELETINHFNCLKTYDFSTLYQAGNSKFYDVIFLNHIDENTFGAFRDTSIETVFFKEYDLLKDDAMPESLKNKIMIPRQ